MVEISHYKKFNHFCHVHQHFHRLHRAARHKRPNQCNNQWRAWSSGPRRKRARMRLVSTRPNQRVDWAGFSAPHTPKWARAIWTNHSIIITLRKYTLFDRPLFAAVIYHFLVLTKKFDDSIIKHVLWLTRQSTQSPLKNGTRLGGNHLIDVWQ